MSWASSSSESLLKVITSFWHRFLEWMNPMILGGHSRWLSPLLHSSLLLLPLQFVLLIWETLVKYNCMVSAFRIFTFFNWFLKVIFRFMFFPSNSLVKESNIFGVFREDTCGTSWSMIESTMIYLALTKFSLCKASSLISFWNWNLSTHVGVQFIFFREIIYFHAWKLSTSPSLSSSWCDRSLWNENLKWK